MDSEKEQITVLLATENETIKKYVSQINDGTSFFYIDNLDKNQSDAKYDLIICEENTSLDISNINNYRPSHGIIVYIDDNKSQIPKATGDELKMVHILKPISLANFIIKIDEIIQRIKIEKRLKKVIIETNNYLIDLNKHLAYKKDDKQKFIHLTEQEGSLIEYLHQNRDEELQKDDILKNLWGYSVGVLDTGIVSNAIYKLRKKFQDIGINDIIISAKHGYKLNLNTERDESARKIN